MKAEHRHELKTNELAQWLGQLPQWTKQNFKIIIAVAAAVVIGGGGLFLRQHYKKIQTIQEQVDFTNALASLEATKAQVVADRARDEDSSFNLLQVAMMLRNTAQSTTNDKIAALALIKQAQALRTELHYRPAGISDTELASRLTEARNAYLQALTKAQGSSTLTAEAKFGLGMCDEEQGNFEQAEEIYRQLNADPTLRATAAAHAAELRLKTIDEYKKKITFAPPPQTRAPKDGDAQSNIETTQSTRPGTETPQLTGANAK